MQNLNIRSERTFFKNSYGVVTEWIFTVHNLEDEPVSDFVATKVVKQLVTSIPEAKSYIPLKEEEREWHQTYVDEITVTEPGQVFVRIKTPNLD